MPVLCKCSRKWLFYRGLNRVPRAEVPCCGVKQAANDSVQPLSRQLLPGEHRVDPVTNCKLPAAIWQIFAPVPNGRFLIRQGTEGCWRICGEFSGLKFLYLVPAAPNLILLGGNLKAQLLLEGFFDIEGKYTGLLSRALTSPCGRIRIPINEDRGETGQIVEYLKRYNGEGIQHIAVGTDDIYASADAIAGRGLKFMPKPPKAYYELSKTRVVGHEEPIEELAKHGILIDGEGVVDGGETKILLQIFSKTVIGPIFFEFIQRKGDNGFGEGNFRALFESIEQDQIERGVIKAA
jgi:Glyoxalase/Bleomycin resistance protein/Dioxygenase superfamily